MPRPDRRLLAATALAAALGLAAPASLLAQQGSTPAPPSSINQPAMDQSQTGVPSGSGSHGSAQDAGSAGPTAQPQAMKSPAGSEQLAAQGEKLVGRDLYGADDEKIGAVDKVVMGPNNRASSVLVDIGGFLGMGAKTVSIPVSQLQADGDRIVAQNITRERARDMQEYRPADNGSGSTGQKQN